MALQAIVSEKSGPVQRSEYATLRNMTERLRSGQLIVKGFEVEDSVATDEQKEIPTSLWQILGFDNPRLESASGGGKQYIALLIGENENH